MTQVPGEQMQQQPEKSGLPSADVSCGSDEEPELSVVIGAYFRRKVLFGKVEKLSESLHGRN